MRLYIFFPGRNVCALFMNDVALLSADQRFQRIKELSVEAIKP